MSKSFLSNKRKSTHDDLVKPNPNVTSNFSSSTYFLEKNRNPVFQYLCRNPLLGK